MSAAVAKAERRAPPLAVVGYAYHVTQIKRSLDGVPWWKRLVFYWLWLPAVRFVSARLRLPVMIDDRGSSPCWTEHQGTFTTQELAEVAIAGRPDWHWTEVPVNGMNPEATGRYNAQDTPGVNTLQYKRANGNEMIDRRALERVHDRIKDLAAS